MGPIVTALVTGISVMIGSRAISEHVMAVPGGRRRDGSGRWPCAGEMVVACGRAPASTTSSEDGGFST